MSNLGFDTLKTYLKLIFDNRADLETPTNYYGVWVNFAYKDLTSRNRWWGRKMKFDFPQLETDSDREDAAVTTTDGVAYVSVPTGALIVRDIWDSTSDAELERITWKEYVDQTGRANTSSEGQPTQWVRNGSYLYLYPTPDTTYSLRVYFRKIPSALTGTSSTVIGEEWDEPILELAAVKGYTWLKNWEAVKAHKEQFMEIVDGLIGIYEEEEKDIEGRIKPDQQSTSFGFER